MTTLENKLRTEGVIIIDVGNAPELPKCGMKTTLAVFDCLGQVRLYKVVCNRPKDHHLFDEFGDRQAHVHRGDAALTKAGVCVAWELTSPLMFIVNGRWADDNRDVRPDVTPE